MESKSVSSRNPRVARVQQTFWNAQKDKDPTHDEKVIQMQDILDIVIFAMLEFEHEEWDNEDKRVGTRAIVSAILGHGSNEMYIERIMDEMAPQLWFQAPPKKRQSYFASCCSCFCSASKCLESLVCRRKLDVSINI